MAPAPDAIVERLTALGFSGYESRTYVGLLALGTTTGYALSNQTGVPQPKVYETLRRLRDRGAVVQTSERPARWSAVPSATVLERLEEDFAGRIEAARQELATLGAGGDEDDAQMVWHLHRADAVRDRARALLDAATGHVYLSGRGPVLAELGDAVAAADARGVEFSVLHFGRLPFPAPRGRAFRHASTDSALYPSRQANHLALVVDSRLALWAVARDGRTWHGLNADDPLLAGVVKGYIRHDIFVQRMYAEFPDELESRFGKGLLELADLSTPVGDEGAGPSRDTGPAADDAGERSA